VPFELCGLKGHAIPGVGGELRFLCDEMLRGLGRWLRAAGYDTVIATGGLPDRALARLCAGEHRVLLTKDRRLAATVEGTAPVVLVPGDGVDEAARGLSFALGIDWLRAPFSRCIVDNRPLTAAPQSAATRVPEKSRAAGGPLRVCPACGRLYWPGSHVRRMQRRLAGWQREAGPPVNRDAVERFPMRLNSLIRDKKEVIARSASRDEAISGRTSSCPPGIASLRSQ
jgi:uncharacterized protein with PIN domain